MHHIPLCIQSHQRHSEVEQQQNTLSSLLPRTSITSYCLLSLKIHRLLHTKGAAPRALVQPPSRQPAALQTRRLQRSGQGLLSPTRAGRVPTPDPLADGRRGTGHGQTVMHLLSGEEGDSNLLFFLSYETPVAIKDCPYPNGMVRIENGTDPLFLLLPATARLSTYAPPVRAYCCIYCRAPQHFAHLPSHSLSPSQRCRTEGPAA